MALTPQQRADLGELLFALRDGTLDADSHARLERLVLADDEARQRFVDTMHLRAALHWRCADRGAASPSSTSAALPAVVSTSKRLNARPKRQAARWLALAASILAVAVGLTVWVWNREPAAVARVTKSVNAKWNSAPARDGSALAAGTRLDLASGAVEIAFASGTRVTLAGPARFEVLSSMRGRLTDGMVTAKAPPALKGFTVETPSLTVVDLGTEFGVRTSESGQSEVHVFDGVVEATAAKNTGRKIKLAERQAIRCDVKTGTLDDVAFDDEHFVRDATAGPRAATASGSFAEPFESLDHLKLQPGYKCATSDVSLAADHHAGSAALEIAWQAAADNYGVVYVSKKVAPTDITGGTLEVWIKPLTNNSGYWGIELYDDRGRSVEVHRVFQLKVGAWNRVAFPQGRDRGAGNFFQAGPGDKRRVSKVVFRAQTHESGQSARDLWDAFQLIPPK
jgi:hypothetical protein